MKAKKQPYYPSINRRKNKLRLKFIKLRTLAPKHNSCQHNLLNDNNYNFSCFFPATLADTQTDLALYIGLAVAITLVAVLFFFLVRVYYRKGQHQSLYNMTASGNVYNFYLLFLHGYERTF